jgi:hypothetical protein
VKVSLPKVIIVVVIVIVVSPSSRSHLNCECPVGPVGRDGCVIDTLVKELGHGLDLFDLR